MDGYFDIIQNNSYYYIEQIGINNTRYKKSIR